MIVLLYTALILINILFALLKKNSKLVFVLTILGQAIVMCGNNMNADYSGYMYFYSTQNYPDSMEIGYVWLSKVAYGLGLDFQSFRIILLLIGIISMYAISFYLSKNIHLLSVLYLSTMIFLDVVQIRQFIAFVVMTYALLMHSKGKKILFCLLILLGSTFQITILVYLPLAFLRNDHISSKRFLKTFFIGIVIVCVLVFVSGSRLVFLKDIMSGFIESDKMVYFTTRARFGFLKYYPFHFICMYISWSIQKYYLNRDMECRKEIKCFVDSTYMCILISSAAMPLIMLNNNFLRFFKFGLIPLFICLSCFLYDTRDGYRYDKSSKVPLGAHYVGGREFVYIFCVLLIMAYGLMMQVSTEAYNVLHYNIFF